MSSINSFARTPSPQVQIGPSENLSNKPGGQGFGVTFRDNRQVSIHRWYPYVEGFSSLYVDLLFERFGPPIRVYDPFGGAGTTQLTAALARIQSFYAEVNPFMRFVANTKIMSAMWARQHYNEFCEMASEFIRRIEKGELARLGRSVKLDAYHSAFPGRDFFEEVHIRQLLAAKRLAEEISTHSQHAHNLLKLACAANLIRSSNMTRRADLRRRRPDEYKERVVDVPAFLVATVEQMIGDIKNLPQQAERTTCVSFDARELPKRHADGFDMAITSPPYLNGTNYFRNTKIELWYLDFIQSEDELAQFRTSAVCAGINNVSSRRNLGKNSFQEVESIVSLLQQTEGDKRIPLMIRGYFSDMYSVLSETYRCLKPHGILALDIGDSVFYGVHVPTDRLLVTVAEQAGFTCEAQNLLAHRYSRSNIGLKQIEIILRKPA